MKLIFIGVLFINILFFIYNTFFTTDTDSIKQTISIKDKSQIVLIKELNSEQLEKLQASPPNKDKPAIEDHLSVDKMLADAKQENLGISDILVQDKVKNVCYSLGPFSKKVMNEVRSELEEKYSRQLSFDIQTTSATTYYRIYIPPINDKAEISAALLKLNKNGLDDHYVMTLNGRKNAIALGVYKQKNTAEEIAQRAKDIGFTTIVEAISKDKDSLYNLKIHFKSNNDMTDYNKLIEEKNLQSTLCNSL